LGLDFPFGLPQEFVVAQGWRPDWAGYASQAVAMPFANFRDAIERFRAGRPDGQKQPGRRVDRLARSQSPLTTVRTPVANMFHAGVRWLIDAPADVLPFRAMGAPTTVVEAYPALIARRLVAGNKYKDGKTSQTREVRDTMLCRIRRGDLREEFGFDVRLADSLEKLCLVDDHGDVLDSVLCAMQAAWAFTQHDLGWGIPEEIDKEGWITAPALVRESAVLTPPRTAFNSSMTRVRPVFRALLERDATASRWLSTLFRLASRNQHLANALAATSCELAIDSIRTGGVETTGRSSARLEACFERQFVPPVALLEWCIKNPRRLNRPRLRVDAPISRAGRGQRAALLGEAGVRQADAEREALRLMAEGGAKGSRRAWWAFEGFTSVDCALETRDYLLIIEGKRFEPVSDTGSWITARNQISRNLEVASQYAGEHEKQFAVLLIGPDECQAPDDSDLRAGWPHLALEEQDRLLGHLLGATTWRQVCASLGIDYQGLPLTVADIV
jgi:hypothetical protein